MTMTLWYWIFFAIYALLIVGTMVTVLLENRQPSKAIAWILVLIFLPVVGLILYIFLCFCFVCHKIKNGYILFINITA